jgi:hypothetical protein
MSVNKEYKERLIQIVQFSGRRYRNMLCYSRFDRVRRVSKLLRDVVDRLYLRVIRLRAIYETDGVMIFKVLRCGHEPEMRFGEGCIEFDLWKSCDICLPVWRLWVMAEGLWNAFDKTVRFPGKKIRELKVWMDKWGL